jgi:glycine dehydrogenase subunit 2
MKHVKLRRYHSASWDEPMIMEMGSKGERGIAVPEADPDIVETVGNAADLIPIAMRRRELPNLPEISQYHVLQHYLRLSQMTMGMETGVDIGEGTCTMKYSPKINEALVRLPQMTELHPSQHEDTLQGLLEIVYRLEGFLKEISGMDAFTFQPGGGSHATYTNACTVRQYHALRGELMQRDEMITTIFSHPCDAATPATAGFKVINLMPDANGYPDLDALKAVVSERTAGIMMTNPEDTGLYNSSVGKYVKVVHDAGGICFTDQANANGILGIVRAFDAGFDACHFNLHKTFSSPHGCEGPASGAYGVRKELARFLPIPVVIFDGKKYRLDYDRPESIGKVRSFLGNLECVVRAYAWIMNMGPDGLRMVAETSVINHNYLDKLLMEIPGVSRPYGKDKRRLEQARYSLEKLYQDTGVGTEAVRDRMVDFGIQSYWMSHHPWIVPQPFTPEACETYSKKDIEYWAAVIRKIAEEAYESPEKVMTSPHCQAVKKIKNHEMLEESEKCSLTWRAYLKKKVSAEHSKPLKPEIRQD